MSGAIRHYTNPEQAADMAFRLLDNMKLINQLVAERDAARGTAAALEAQLAMWEAPEPTDLEHRVAYYFDDIDTAIRRFVTVRTDRIRAAVAGEGA